MESIRKLILALITGCLAGPVLAGEPVPVPEPGILALLGLGGIVVAVAAFRNRHK